MVSKIMKLSAFMVIAIFSCNAQDNVILNPYDPNNYQNDQVAIFTGVNTQDAFFANLAASVHCRLVTFDKFPIARVLFTTSTDLSFEDRLNHFLRTNHLNRIQYMVIGHTQYDLTDFSDSDSDTGSYESDSDDNEMYF